MKSSDSPNHLPEDLLGNPAHTVSATVSTLIAVPQSALFDWFTQLDLPRVLRGYGPLPAVTDTTDQSGDWDVPGQTRTLRMSGEISAVQEILDSQAPHYFAYRVTGFTHFLRFFVHGAEARWRFDRQSADQTELRWTYTFWGRSSFAKLAIYPVIKLIWIRYMRQAISRMKQLAEREARQIGSDC